ncbi:MAG: GNAT family N-acetyltransferase [Ignavibacteria bacterium]|nr:GNAT family N-acetyltransferase [Ignavibacteria bacterium]
MTDFNYIIETKRLKLREFVTGDNGFIYKLLNSPGWLKYIGNRKINSDDDALKYIEEILINGYKTQGFGFYLIELKEAGENAGMCGLVKRPGLKNVDLGFALLPEFENYGYAFEASIGVLDYASKILKLKKVAAITVTQNLPSIKLLQKLGMTFEKKINIPNDHEDLLLYGLELKNLLLIK